MAKTLVEVLVDDLDGTEAVESVRLGWNGQWRQLELSEKNLAALSKAIDRFWDAGRPIKGGRPAPAAAGDRHRWARPARHPGVGGRERHRRARPWPHPP